jgi:hypothetical protein
MSGHFAPRGEAMAGISGKRGNAMTHQPTHTSDKAGRNAVIAILLPCLLIGHFSGTC